MLVSKIYATNWKLPRMIVVNMALFMGIVPNIESINTKWSPVKNVKFLRYFDTFPLFHDAEFVLLDV